MVQGRYSSLLSTRLYQREEDWEAQQKFEFCHGVFHNPDIFPFVRNPLLLLRHKLQCAHQSHQRQSDVPGIFRE